MTDPSPAWLTEHTAVVEAVLAEHAFAGWSYKPGRWRCRCRESGPVSMDAPGHRAHVATAITTALAEKGGASDG